MVSRTLAVLTGFSLALLAAAGALAMSPQAQTGPSAMAAPAQVLYVITYRAGPSWKPGVPMRDQGLRDHFYSMRRLHAAGRIAIAGQLGPDGGLVLLHAHDLADADAIIAADPAVAAGLFVGEARRFVPRFVSTKPLAPVAP